MKLERASDDPHATPASRSRSSDIEDDGGERWPYGKQPCLGCGYLISDIAGSKAAICPNCGFKDPCC